MAENRYKLPTLEKGPNCDDCPAAAKCDAIKLMFSIELLNEDLAREDVGLNIKERVQGEVFVYGMGKIERNTSIVQTGINQCLGAIAAVRRDDNSSTFTFPSFGGETTTNHRTIEDADQLKARGFEVIGDQRISSVIDPNSTINMDLLWGLQNVIVSARKAASFVVKNY